MLPGELPGGQARREDEKEAVPVLRGTMHRAIVLKSPDDVFEEAVFLLKDSFHQGDGIGRRELLRQASEAAGIYFPPCRRKGGALAPAALFLLGAAAAIFVLWAMGLL